MVVDDYTMGVFVGLFSALVSALILMYIFLDPEGKDEK